MTLLARLQYGEICSAKAVLQERPKAAPDEQAPKPPVPVQSAPSPASGGEPAPPKRAYRARIARSPAAAEEPPPVKEETLDQQLKKLAAGKFAYDVPDQMKQGQWFTVRARISKGVISVATLTDGFSDAGRNPAVALPVSTKMKVTLTGPEFEIKAASPDEQFVDGSSPTTWEWDVKPDKRGKQELRLAAIVELNGVVKEFKVVERTVTVKVDALGDVVSFLGANWQWLFGTISGSGIIGLMISRFRKKAA